MSVPVIVEFALTLSCLCLFSATWRENSESSSSTLAAPGFEKLHLRFLEKVVVLQNPDDLETSPLARNQFRSSSWWARNMRATLIIGSIRLRKALKSMSDINQMFDKASVMNNWSGVGSVAMVGNAGAGVVKGLGESAVRTAPTMWSEGERRFVVTARGLIRSSRGPGRSTFYYTLARGREARDFEALATGFADGGEHVALDFAVHAFGAVGAVLNPAPHVGEKMQEMGAEMSVSTFETIQSLQDTYRTISDYISKNCN